MKVGELRRDYHTNEYCVVLDIIDEIHCVILWLGLTHHNGEHWGFGYQRLQCTQTMEKRTQLMPD